MKVVTDILTYRSSGLLFRFSEKETCAKASITISNAAKCFPETKPCRDGKSEKQAGIFVSRVLGSIARQAADAIKTKTDARVYVSAQWDRAVQTIKQAFKKKVTTMSLSEYRDEAMEEHSIELERFLKDIKSRGYPMPRRVEQWERIVQANAFGIDKVSIYGEELEIKQLMSYVRNGETVVSSSLVMSGIELAGLYTLGELIRKEAGMLNVDAAIQKKIVEVKITPGDFMAKAGYFATNGKSNVNNFRRKTKEMSDALEKLSVSIVPILEKKKDIGNGVFNNTEGYFRFKSEKGLWTFSNLEKMQVLEKDDKPFRSVPTYPLRYATQEAGSKAYFTNTMRLITSVLRHRAYTEKNITIQMNAFGLGSHGRSAEACEEIKKTIKQALQLSPCLVHFRRGTCHISPL